MADAQTVHVLGSGGGIVEMSLPLHEAIADQIAAGYARLVKADGSPYDEADRPLAAPGLRDSRPPLNATKAEWVSWAVFNGANADEANAANKTDLIEKYGQIEPGTGQHVATDPVVDPDGAAVPVDPAAPTA